MIRHNYTFQNNKTKSISSWINSNWWKILRHKEKRLNNKSFMIKAQEMSWHTWSRRSKMRQLCSEAKMNNTLEVYAKSLFTSNKREKNSKKGKLGSLDIPRREWQGPEGSKIPIRALRIGFQEADRCPMTAFSRIAWIVGTLFNSFVWGYSPVGSFNKV